ncbi:MAG: LemA-like protein [Parcubacteria group bacterium GW2011_GWA2_38_13]|nr:MAG: LemA-like protein [Parcubacteria group bacterium GW2011_GWA2_38_13]
MDTFLLVIFGVVALAIVWLIFVYNGLITFRNRTQEAWSDIDVQLKRRYDLIPNLVETVKGYAGHEKQLFENVTKARSQAMQAQGVEAKAKAENTLTDTLKSLFAVAENYPTLRASENFAKLQDELSDTENKIQASRRFYNGNARDFNIKIEVFPNNLIAAPMGFKKFEFFEIAEGEKAPVKVSF